MKRNYLSTEENPDYPYDSYKAKTGLPANVDIKFYRCEVCGQIMVAIGEIANPLTCCGKDMKLLVPNMVEASAEHHIPVYTRIGHKVIVEVGELEHPMSEAHHIEWVCLVTNLGVQWHPLEFDDMPTTTFRIKGSEAILAIYAHCNLHGLWCCLECKEDY